MKKSDYITGFILLIFGIVVFIGSIDYRFGTIYDPGAGFVPRVVSLILVGISGIIILNEFAKSFIRKEEGPSKQFFPTKDAPKRIALASVFLLAYRFLFPILGFAPTNFICFLFATRTLGHYSWKRCLVFSFLSSIIAYVLFQVWLSIPMPIGILKI